MCELYKPMELPYDVPMCTGVCVRWAAHVQAGGDWHWLPPSARALFPLTSELLGAEFTAVRT